MKAVLHDPLYIQWDTHPRRVEFGRGQLHSKVGLDFRCSQGLSPAEQIWVGGWAREYDFLLHGERILGNVNDVHAIYRVQATCHLRSNEELVVCSAQVEYFDHPCTVRDVAS